MLHKFKEKAFPHLDTLSIVFGKDRATGKGMEHPYDVIEELDREAGHDTDADDIPKSHSQEVIPENTGEASSKHKKKGRLSGDNESFEIMRESFAYVGSELFRSSQLIKAELDEVTLTEKRKRFTKHVMNMNLSMNECLTAIGAIGTNRDLLDLFFTLSDDLKNIWVRRYASRQF
ncbi:uncharacterized protein A4U43_C04F32820 [Asparagus officinalis]|uniref:Uncharacterized protein n=1 Tax=Asparagus officinalis TaxID=4686 RepID=A0A5P1F743_ASPOF|nr:uncharacterized protein A4U43_C04F32820 [Asparagus officinalis]